MNRKVHKRSVFAMGLVLVAVSLCRAQQPPPVSELDRQLLDDLAPAIPEKKPSSADKNRDPSATAGEDLGAGPSGPDPLTVELTRLGAEMKAIGAELKAGDGAAAARSRQERVVADLTNLIAQLEQPSSGAAGSSAAMTAAAASTVQQPRPDSAPGDDPAEATGQNPVTPDDLKSGVWGRLPERWRRQMASGAAEEFLPQYRNLIEAYYRRLAETPSAE